MTDDLTPFGRKMVSGLLSRSSTDQLPRIRLEQIAAAKQGAGQLLGCFRTGDAHDPKIYIAAVVAVLERFPVATIKAVTDPSTGLPSKLKWLPTLAEITEACEVHGAPAKREAERQSAAERFAAENALFADHREGRLSLEELKARHGQNWGIGTDQEAPQVKKERAFKRYTDNEIRALYGSSEERKG